MRRFLRVFFVLNYPLSKNLLQTFVFSTHQKIPCLYFDNDMFQTKDNDRSQNSSTNFAIFAVALCKTPNEKRIEIQMGVDFLKKNL